MVEVDVAPGEGDQLAAAQPGRPQQATHPYIIRPIQRLGGEEAEVLSLDVTLMDDALEALPHFVYAFIEFGHFGLGREKAQFELMRVSLGGKVVYRNGDSNIEMPGEALYLHECIPTFQFAGTGESYGKGVEGT